VLAKRLGHNIGRKKGRGFFPLVNSMRKFMTKIEKGWTRVEKFIVGLLALSATLLSFYGVITRYIFRRPPDWAEEICIYMIIWAVFITASTLAGKRPWAAT
jgi:TRAP-type C4-dicarboxylate transport system permease small subunit